MNQRPQPSAFTPAELDGLMATHEETPAVTADGPELLSRRAPEEMPVVA